MMKRLLTIAALLALSAGAHADPAYGAFSQLSGNSTVGTSWSHVGTGSDECLAVAIIQNGATSETITVTHDGNSVAAVSGFPAGSSNFAEGPGLNVYWFFATGISTGTNTIAFTKSGSDAVWAAAWSFTTASNACEVNNSATGIDNGAGGSATPSDTIALSSVTSIVVQILASGEGNPDNVDPRTGWGEDGFEDAGSVVIEWYRYLTVASADVIYGYDMTGTDDSYVSALAINEVSGGSSGLLRRRRSN